MNYRGSYRKLLGNAKSAIMAAIEVYNKPSFKYRDECFVNKTWEMVVLDDPVQSLDDLHAQALVDILRELSQKKQVIILTHQNWFRQQLEAGFHGEPFMQYELRQGDEQGPVLEAFGESLQRLLDIAQQNADGGYDRRKSAATALRQSLEIFGTRALRKLGRTSRQVQRIRDLDDLLKALEEAGVQQADIQQLRMIKVACGAGPHELLPQDVSPKDVKAGVSRMQNLRGKYL